MMMYGSICLGSQLAPLRPESNHDLPSALDRLVHRAQQLDALPPLEAVYQGGSAGIQTGDDVLIVRLVSEAVNVGRIYGVLLPDQVIFRHWLRELPCLNRIYGESANFDRPTLA